jgi:hypothetical protein
MQIDFRFSEGWDEEFADLSTVSETELRYYIATGDVILCDDQADLSTQWGWIPLVDFVVALREIAEALLVAEGSETFEFTESEATLQFERIGDQVAIEASYAPGRITLPLCDFTNRVEELTSRLDRELLKKHPELGLNPEYQRLRLSSPQ